MRVVRLELPTRLRSATGTVDLSSPEVRAEIAREMPTLVAELSELVRQRACAYFPPAYTIFVRTRFEPEPPGTVTELWIVDPTIRWPQSLLARKAWKLFVPVLAHMVADAYRVRLEGVVADIDEKRAALDVFGSARGWRDPVVLSALVFILTSAIWLWAVPLIAHLLRI